MRNVRVGALKKFKTFISLDHKTLSLYIEAFLFLGWARILKAFPFYKIKHLLGYHMQETSTELMTQNRKQLKEIAIAIHVMSKYTFWESKCLVKAIAGMKMLERRNIESTLYLGSARSTNGKMIAHAWLRSGPYYISGAAEMQDYTVVSTFAKKNIS